MLRCTVCRASVHIDCNAKSNLDSGGKKVFRFVKKWLLFYFILFYFISYDFILAAQSWAATVQSVCSRICVLFDVELA